MAIQYRWPWLYSLLIRIIHRKKVLSAFEKAIGEDVSVLELAAGFGNMKKSMSGSISYVGVDLNDKFIEYGRKKGLDLRKGDILKSDSYIDSDVIVLSDVIHHIPRQHWQELMKLVFIHASQKVVILEPAFLSVKSRSKVFGPVIDWVLKKLDSDGTNDIEQWYTKEEYLMVFRDGFGIDGAKDFTLKYEEVYPYLLAVYTRA